MSIKVKEGKHEQLAHHGLIKLIPEYVLSQLSVPILWSTFTDMDREDVIKAIEYERYPTSSGEEEEEESKEEEEEEPEEEEEELEEEEEAETNKTEEEKNSGEEAQKDETSPEIHIKEGKESPRVSPEPTEKEVAASLTSLSTPIKSTRKRQRKTPLYLKTRRRTRIKQGRPQTPTKTPIIIEDSPKGQEKLVSP